MTQRDKAYKVLLELYKLVYADLGVDWDSLDKVDNFFMDYEIEDSRVEEIIKELFVKHKISKNSYYARAIRSSYYMGVSPRSKNIKL